MKTIRVLFTCALVIGLTISIIPYNVNAESSEIEWSEIHETDFKVMNKNVWKANKSFTFNITDFDALAIKIYTNKTPPSTNVSITLKDNEGIKIIHREIVNMTEDEIINGLWHIEYFTESKTVKPNENYTFELTIMTHLKETLEPKEDPTILDTMNYKFGQYGIETPQEEVYIPPPSYPRPTPTLSSNDNQNTNNSQETDSTDKEDDICKSIFSCIGIIGLCSIASYNKRKRGRP